MFLLCTDGDHAKLSCRDWVREANAAVNGHEISAPRGAVWDAVILYPRLSSLHL